MDLSSFHHNLPIKIKEVLKEVSLQGFKIGIVGGICRDYLLKNQIGHDFDCEVRPKDGHSIDEWSKISEILIKNYEAQVMAYDVLKIDFSGYSMEMTLPRIEHYDGGKGHSNFTAEFIADIDYSKGFIRRDFTINAIMFEYDGKNWSLRDPLNAVEDLNQKLLNNCSTHFLLDPVRFLRAFRFKINLGFTFSQILVQNLERIDLSNLTVHYVKQELSKCKKPMLMLKKMLEYRGDLNSDIVIHASNKTYIDYDHFYKGELEIHIKEAVIMPLKMRQTLLKYLGFSDKHILFNVKFEQSWKTLIQEEFNSEKLQNFYDTILQLEKLQVSQEKLSYLLNYYEFDLSSEQFMIFKDIKYELSENDLASPKENYKFIIFVKRFKALNAQLS